MKKRYKIKLTILLLLLFRLSYGQLPDIVAMEYFFDVDPGYGLGENVAVTSGIQIDEDFVADMSDLDIGFHTLFVRVKDEYGKWSLAYTNSLYKFPDTVPSANPVDLPQIIAMEYFFDEDPGFGLGESIPVASGIQVDEAFNADMDSLGVGFHVLNVRVKDEYNNWSLAFTNPVYKFPDVIPSATPLSLPQITAIEYFFDIDPGFGNSTEILNTPDSIIVDNFIAELSMLGPGIHLIYTRVKDDNNIWSLSVVDYFCLQGIQVFLEGPHDSISGFMQTTLNDAGLLPLEQPFNSNPAANWFYDGTETVSSIPNANIVDWLLLQVRDATSPENATSATIKENQVAFLLNNGRVVALDGESFVSFTEPIDDELYLVVFHRNHLGVMSAFPLNTTGECDLTYSFSLGPNQVYGNENGHKEISPGVWGKISGDGNGSGQITIEDKTVVWQSESGNAGFLPGDYNMDGQVGNSDKNDIWVPNKDSGSAIPE